MKHLFTLIASLFLIQTFGQLSRTPLGAQGNVGIPLSPAEQLKLQLRTKSFRSTPLPEAGTTHTGWYDNADALGISGYGSPNFFETTLFNDSLAVELDQDPNNFGSIITRPVYFYHLGSIVDPRSLIYDNYPYKSNNSSTYTVDSISIPYIYKRHNKSNTIVDTLIIEIYPSTQIRKYYFPTKSGQVTGTIPYDYTSNLGNLPFKTIKFPLTKTDTASTITFKSFGLNPVLNVPARGQIIASYKYVSGQTYNARDTINFNTFDTINYPVKRRLNEFKALLGYDPNGWYESTINDSPMFRIYDNGMLVEKAVRYNQSSTGWNGYFVSGNAFTNSYYPVMEFKITSTDGPSADCSLLNYSFTSPSATGTINQTSSGGSVAISVPYGTNLNALIASFNISDSANAYVVGVKQISGVTSNNFTATINYKIVAQDTNYSKIYTVTVTVQQNIACDLLTYKFNNPLANAVITPKSYGGLVELTVPNGTNPNGLIASFTLSDSAMAFVGTNKQFSGVTANNFTDTIIYYVVSQNTSFVKIYKVYVTVSKCNLKVTSPPQNQSIAETKNAQFIVSSSDASATFQWQTNQGIGWQNLFNAGQYTGSNDDTLKVSNTTMLNQGQLFRCILSNTTCKDTSASAVLTITCKVLLSASPQNKAVTIAQNATFATSTTDISATIQWQTNVGAGWQNVFNAGQYSGANTNTLTVSNVSFLNNSQLFRSIIGLGSCKDTSAVATLTVNCNVNIGTQPTNQSVNVGSTAQFTTSSTDVSSSFQWQINLGLGWQNIFNAGQFSGATNSTLLISNVSIANNNNQIFRCVINTGSCKDTSSTATLTVKAGGNGIVSTISPFFLLFPNPASTKINISMPIAWSGSICSILDASGRKIWSGIINEQNSTLELSHYAEGIYLFQVEGKYSTIFNLVR